MPYKVVSAAKLLPQTVNNCSAQSLIKHYLGKQRTGKLPYPMSHGRDYKGGTKSERRLYPAFGKYDDVQA